MAARGVMVALGIEGALALLVLAAWAVLRHAH
jgi:hypothetical protein